MRTSIINKGGAGKKPSAGTGGCAAGRALADRAAAVLFWLGVWQIVSMVLGQEILLVSPVLVVRRMWELAGTERYWGAVAYSLLRIQGGFFLALVSGCVLAGLAGRFPRMKRLLAPLLISMKSIPVASFTILLLLWVSSSGLSLAISFIMVFPIVYTNLLQGVEGLDEKLTEMAEIFHISGGRRIRYIYLPQLFPYLLSACRIGLGMAWKAGAAAEVIGIPKGSMGEALYEAKIYLNTADLFAWTLTIVLLGLTLEKCLLWLLKGTEALLKEPDRAARQKKSC